MIIDFGYDFQVHPKEPLLIQLDFIYYALKILEHNDHFDWWDFNAALHYAVTTDTYQGYTAV